MVAAHELMKASSNPRQPARMISVSTGLDEGLDPGDPNWETPGRIFSPGRPYVSYSRLHSLHRTRQQWRI
jgi:hypothetical protein